LIEEVILFNLQVLFLGFTSLAGGVLQFSTLFLLGLVQYIKTLITIWS